MDNILKIRTSIKPAGLNVYLHVYPVKQLLQLKESAHISPAIS